MHTTGTPLVTKVDGNVESFNHRKLAHSLRRSGAREDVIADIVARIETEISDGMSTDDIYRRAQSLLKNRQRVAAVKYSLRRALFSLGPTGFPFEDFLAELFEAQGYQTKTGVVVQGRCVEHEVDLIAYKADHCFIAEAKFHAHPGVKSDLQVALYSHARFQDLKGMRPLKNHPCEIVDSYIITNTKFTNVAIEYANCVGVKLLSWNYPKKNTLQNYIEAAGIYPITALTSLSVEGKRVLLENGVVLCKDMAHKRDLLKSLGFASHKIENIIEESVNVCTSSPQYGTLSADYQL